MTAGGYRTPTGRHAKINVLGPLAQRLEQRTHNPLVEGSNPSGPTKFSLSIPDTWL